MEISKKVVPNAANPFGVANPVRGAGYNNAAVLFAKKFPIGSSITIDEFDEFGILHGFIPAPASREKSSDGWKAHLQRRAEFRNNLNRAACHPRILDSEVDPYSTQYDGQQKLVVKGPFVAVAENRLPAKLKSVLVTRRKQIKDLGQSVDYSILTPSEQQELRLIHRNLDRFSDDINITATRMDEDFIDFRTNLLNRIESEGLKPLNGGIKGLLENEIVDGGSNQHD